MKSDGQFSKSEKIGETLLPRMPSIWEKPWPYLVCTLVFVILGAGSYFASQNQWLSWFGGLVAYDWSERFAVLVGISLILAVAQSLRTWIVGASRVTFLRSERGSREQYENLDILRLFLAISVLFDHGYNATGPKLTGLFFAVPCFLAISGFVVLQSFEYSSNWVHFAWKRFLRVGPAFVVSLGFTALLMGTPAIFGTLHTWYTLGITGYEGDAVVWSLGWEELYYAALAIIFLAGGYRRPIVVWSLLIVSILVAITILPGATGYVQNAIVLGAAFFTGNLFFLYRDRLKRLPKWLPIVALVVTALAFTIRGDDPVLQFLHQVLFTGAFIWFAAFGPSIARRLPADLSYGCYLFHLPLVAYVRDHINHSRWPLLGIVLVASLAMAAISWYGVERYALRLKNWWIGVRPVSRATAT